MSRWGGLLIFRINIGKIKVLVRRIVGIYTRFSILGTLERSVKGSETRYRVVVEKLNILTEIGYLSCIYGNIYC